MLEQRSAVTGTRMVGMRMVMVVVALLKALQGPLHVRNLMRIQRQAVVGVLPNSAELRLGSR